jgi:hypothetical protein
VGGKGGKRFSNRRREALERKKGYVHDLDMVTTLFLFTNFLEGAKTSSMCQFFARYGRMGEVFIPKKLDKWGKCFCYFKFKDVNDEDTLEASLEEIWLDGGEAEGEQSMLWEGGATQ